MDADEINELVSILEALRKDGVVCPYPKEWLFFYEKVCNGFDELKKNPDYDNHKNKPLILSGWHDNERNQTLNFYNSIVYFYKRYPEKRPAMKDFLINNKKWHTNLFDPMIVESIINDLKKSISK